MRQPEQTPEPNPSPPPATEQPTPDASQMLIGLAAQLFLTHFVAAGIGLLLWIFLLHDVQIGQVLLLLAASGMVGVGLNFNLYRALRLLDGALRCLVNLWPLPPFSAQILSPMAGILAQINVLAERERPLAEMRKKQLQHAGEVAAQAERNRMARDLHDSIKQQLFGIQISAAATEARWPQDADGARATLADVRASAKAALVEMNALLQQLSPAPLEQVGLVQALREQAEALGYRTGATVEVHIGQLPEEGRFPVGSQEAIFRIAQEAFSNVARHARAKQVALRLEMAESAATEPGSFPVPVLVLEIRDDGQGFEATAVAGGMGLHNIQQRVDEIGGRLTIEAAPGRGTGIRVALPLHDFVDQKEQLMDSPSSSLNRLGLTGFLGGLILAAVLYYPLARLLPGSYVVDWPAGTVVLGWVGLLAAVPLIIGSGYLGARQMKVNGRGAHAAWGAVSGLITAVTFYCLLGGAAAAVAGSQTLLAHGYKPALSELHFLYLLADAVNGIIWWVFGSFWLTLAAGLVLGAAGGLFGSRQDDHAGSGSTTAGAVHSLLVVLVGSSGLSLFLTTAVFSLLGEQIAETAVEVAAAGYTLLYPAWGTGFWPLCTTSLIYLVSLLIFYEFSRRHTPHLQWYERRLLLIGTTWCALWAAVLPLLLLAVAPGLKQGLFWLGLLANLALALLLGRQVERIAAGFPRKGEPVRALEILYQWGLPAAAALAFVLAWEGAWVQGGVALLLAAVIQVTGHNRDLQPVLAASRPLARSLHLAMQTAFPTILAFVLPIFVVIPAASGLVLLIIPAIAPLDPLDPSAGADLAAQVQQLYSIQWANVVAWLTVGAMVVGILLLVLKIMSLKREGGVQAVAGKR